MRYLTIFAVVVFASCFHSHTLYGQEQGVQGQEKVERPRGKAGQQDGKFKGDRKKGNKRGAKNKQSQGRSKKGKQGQGQFNVERFFQRLDRDQNGAIEKSEVPERLLQRWQRIDQNGNDILDKEELTSLIERIQQMRNRGQGAKGKGEGKGKGKGDGKGKGQGKGGKGKGGKGKGGQKGDGPVKPKRPGSDDGKE